MATPPTPVQPVAEPIQANSTPEPAQLTSALRTLFTVLGTSAGVLGYPHLDTWLGQGALVVGPLVAVIAIVLGQLHIRKAEQQKAVMADKLDDSIAKVVDSRILK